MKQLIAIPLRFLILATRQVQRILLDLDRRLGAGFDPERHAVRVKRSTVVHNMMADPDEKHYAEQYWAAIEKNLDAARIARGGVFLDLGCGQGRLTLPLARWAHEAGGQVQGVDLSESAVMQARDYARAKGITNATFAVADVIDDLGERDDASIDAIMITEVLYFTDNQDKILTEIKRVLKPGGLLFASFRSQYFCALLLVSEGLYGAMPMLLEERSGRLLGNDVWLNWNTSQEVRSLLEDKGFAFVEMLGIGTCSGIAGDPHSLLARPARLSARDRTSLVELEQEIGRSIPDGGRYILTVARKR